MTSGMCTCDPAVSGSRLLVADCLDPVRDKLGPPQTIFFSHVPWTLSQSAESALKALCHIPPTVPIPMLFTSTLSGVNDVADHVCAHDS